MTSSISLTTTLLFTLLLLVIYDFDVFVLACSVLRAGGGGVNPLLTARNGAGLVPVEARSKVADSAKRVEDSIDCCMTSTMACEEISSGRG